MTDDFTFPIEQCVGIVSTVLTHHEFVWSVYLIHTAVGDRSDGGRCDRVIDVDLDLDPVL